MDNENSGAAELAPDSRTVAPLLLTEPFPCPHCGQMLAPSCRSCVACHQPIDITQIRRPEPGASALPQPGATVPTTQTRHFSWPIFFVVFAAAFAIISIGVRFVGVETSQLMFIGITFACAGWVFMDAHAKGLPRPWRWSIMTLFFWIIFFPWYLGRRRKPRDPCLVIESPHSILFRVLFWFVLVSLFFLFLSFITAMVKIPPH